MKEEEELQLQQIVKNVKVSVVLFFPCKNSAVGNENVIQVNEFFTRKSPVHYLWSLFHHFTCLLKC